MRISAAAHPVREAKVDQQPSPEHGLETELLSGTSSGQADLRRDYLSSPQRIRPAGASIREAAVHGSDVVGHLFFAEVAQQKGVFDLKSEGAKLETAWQAGTELSASEADRLRLTSGATSARMERDRLQRDAEVLTRAGAYSGAEERWEALNTLNTKNGGKFGVINLLFSPFAPGQRSDDSVGSAYAGRLDTPAETGGPKVSDEARLFSNQGIFERRIDAFSGPGGALADSVSSAISEFRAVPLKKLEFTGVNAESFANLLRHLREAWKTWRVPEKEAPDVVTLNPHN